MNTERPHDLRSWDQISEAERDRYRLLTPEELELVKPMTEDERHQWLERKRLDELKRVIPERQ